jgi:hypothetical protein
MSLTYRFSHTIYERKKERNKERKKEDEYNRKEQI